MADTPLIPLTEWPSYIYWRKDDNRLKQFWYVSFCLLMTSLQDRLTGIALRESGNMNWATTAFYYSAVHAGRLACFVCTGTFPQRHDQLALVFAPDPAETNKVSMDWLSNFVKTIGPATSRESSAMRAHNVPLSELVHSALTAMPEIRHDQLLRFAPLLTKFKNLRNDSNYEALLIAHEGFHFRVTDGFQSLIASADRSSRIATDLCCAVYRSHLQHAICFDRHRDLYFAAHHAYVEARLKVCLQSKFGSSRSASRELQAALSALANVHTSSMPVSEAEVEQFLDPIMYDSFDAKRGLMTRWHDDVDSLRRALPREDER